MKGIDVSHWQGIIDWSKVRDDDVEFAIMKVSQGTSFVDNRFLQNQKDARKEEILCGYYHFANGDNSKQEADHFLQAVGGIKKYEFVVLDFEIQNKQSVDWCLNWLQQVENVLNFRPIIYLNRSLLRAWDWSKVVDNDNGLWIASYGLNTGYKGLKSPNPQDWPFWALWQYTSRGRIDGIRGYVDINYTDMNLATLKKYGKQEHSECTGLCPLHCN